MVFGGAEAVATTRAIVGAGEDRRAGTVGDREAARVTVEAFRTRGFSVEVDRFESDGKDLVNVIGRRAGSTRRQVLVLAARDASGVPDAGGSAADTAALIELARVFEGRPSERTIVLASVDGSALGEVGARRLADRLPNPDLVDGTLVLSGLGAPTSEPPAVVGWSTGTDRAGLGLQRTVAGALREELERVAEAPSPAGQLARLAFPVGVGSQGPLIEAGFDAVRIAGGGELADTSASTVDQVDEDRIGGLGRGAFRVLDALDRSGAPDGKPGAYLTAVSQVMPGWVLSLLAHHADTARACRHGGRVRARSQASDGRCCPGQPGWAPEPARSPSAWAWPTRWRSPGPPPSRPAPRWTLRASRSTPRPLRCWSWCSARWHWRGWRCAPRPPASGRAWRTGRPWGPPWWPG